MKEVFRIAAPLTLWLAAFSALYGLSGIVCSGAWPDSAETGRALLIAAAAAAVGLQALLLLALRSPAYGSRERFTRHVSVTLAVAALVAAVWTSIPVATTSVCL